MHEARDAFLSQLKARTGAWPDFEGLIRDIYVDFLRHGDLAVDVGVNEGHHFVNLGHAVGPNGRVIGVEANGDLADQVMGQVRLHHSDLLGRLEIHKVAVSREPGTATLHIDRRHHGLSSLAMREVSLPHGVDKVTVPVTTLDALVREAPRFVKIDIEGAEYDALCGARTVLSARPLIAFEFDPATPHYFGFKAQDLIELLAGFQITDLFGHPHPTGEDLLSCPTWNFLAIPVGLDLTAVTAPARRAL